MAETTGWDSPWAVRVIGLVTSLILLVVVLAGVKWVVKLQLLLLAILMLSVLDFLVGTFAHTDYGKCKPGQVAHRCEKISYLLNYIVQSGELYVRQLCSMEHFAKKFRLILDRYNVFFIFSQNACLMHDMACEFCAQ